MSQVHTSLEARARKIVEALGGTWSRSRGMCCCPAHADRTPSLSITLGMAQGLTSDRGIAVMDSRERNLANQQTFLVTVTRLRDGLTLFVDNPGKLEAAVERNSGMKRSALETVNLLRDAAASGLAKGRTPEPMREPPELDRSITKPFEIGI